MSRIGKLPVAIPQGVEVTIDGQTVRVKGPKGELSKTLHPEVAVRLDENAVHVEPLNGTGDGKRLHGLSRTLVANMVQGVTEGYQRGLEMVGVGYRANKQGSKVVISVGYSQPIELDPIEGIEIEVPAPNRMIVKGIDKELVGDIAAKIRALREPEPYLGKGIRYEGEYVKRKAGKAGKAAAN